MPSVRAETLRDLPIGGGQGDQVQPVEFVTDVAPGVCRYRTTDPSRLVRRLSRRYTPLRHHTLTASVEPHAQSRVPTGFGGPATPSTR